MGESLNALPVQTYVRNRASTLVRNVANASTGSVALNLDKPGDVTVLVLSDPTEGVPTYFVAAVGRTPTMMDFDILIAPATPDMVKSPDHVTMHLPAMQSTLNWASFAVNGDPEAFAGSTISRLIVAIDQ